MNELMNYLNRIAKGIAMVLKKFEQPQLSETLFEFDTNSTFLKVKNNAFTINKVMFTFVEYDRKSQKLKKNVDIYLSFSDALILCQDIKTGRIPKLAERSKENAENQKKEYAQAIYESPLGGVHEEDASKRKLRSDGKAVSRKFNIAPGKKADYVFTAIQGAGYTDKQTGIIVPEKGTSPDTVIRVTASNNQIKGFALILEKHIEAYLSSSYIKGLPEKKGDDK